MKTASDRPFSWPNPLARQSRGRPMFDGLHLDMSVRVAGTRFISAALFRDIHEQNFGSLGRRGLAILENFDPVILCPPSPTANG